MAEASSKAIAALVFGILGLLCLPCIGPILAIALGWGEKSGPGRAGFILGWIGLGLQILGVILQLALGVFSAVLS